jgi:RNA polymerase sigma-70 factor (ECF subfamily)
LTKSTEKGDHEYQGPAESHAADSVREMTTVGADFELRPVSGADTRCPGSDRPFTDADRAPAQNTEAFSKTAGRASITATALSKTVELSSQTAAASPSPGPGPDPAEPGLAPEADPSPDELEGVPAIGSGDVQESAYADWAELVERIQSGAIDGMEELYQLFSKGVRFYLCRQLGPQELDDKVHDTFVVVVQAIRRGELRDPQRLMGFCRTIVRRQVAAHIDRVVHIRREQIDMESTVRIPDPRGNPEETAIFRQRADLIRRVLKELSERDREILTRFYLREQSQDQICSEMVLTETQFRLLKSRAKARFGELGKKKIAHKALSAVLVRTSGGLSH